MAGDPAHFSNRLSAEIWERKYRYGGNSGSPPETTIADTWNRVARAVASVEPRAAEARHAEFAALLDGFRFLPAGRILASAGTDYDATLFNCFVMGTIEDSIEGIFTRLRESAQTMQRGGGIGCDFSTLRPRHSPAVTSGRTASGPVSFMHLWDAMCRTLVSSGNRRGAMMGTLRCDHPDILEFVDAKRSAEGLTNFNLSVQVTDALVEAVALDQEWPLVFPGQAGTATESVMRAWPGSTEPVRCSEYAKLRAADLWQRIADNAYDAAEPGVLFVDRINACNNLWYRERISTTNPCGEVPLPPFGACNLGSINLATLVESPFSSRARLDLDAAGGIARQATRFLDNVIDLSAFPLDSQAAEARTTRRIGLGITGLADALIMLGLDYASDAGRALARTAMTRIRDEAYRASIELAAEKGAFPAFDRDAYLAGSFVAGLPASIRDRIAATGIRNSHLLAIAPAGSISIVANNVSSGIEPVFAPTQERAVIEPDGSRAAHEVRNFAFDRWLGSGGAPGALPAAFVTAHELTPEAHLLMAATLQPLVDNSISKTVNVAEDIAREDFRAIYRRAYDLGLKGCTVFRNNCLLGPILSAAVTGETAHCCAPEREGD